MILVTASEFSKNFGKYAEIAHKEEVWIMKRGKVYFRALPPKSRAESVEAMRGTIPLNDETKDITIADIRAERRKRYE